MPEFYTGDPKSSHLLGSKSRPLGERKCVPGYCACLTCLAHLQESSDVYTDYSVPFNAVGFIRFL